MVVNSGRMNQGCQARFLFKFKQTLEVTLMFKPVLSELDRNWWNWPVRPVWGSKQSGSRFGTGTSLFFSEPAGFVTNPLVLYRTSKCHTMWPRTFQTQFFKKETRNFEWGSLVVKPMSYYCYAINGNIKFLKDENEI